MSDSVAHPIESEPITVGPWLAALFSVILQTIPFVLMNPVGRVDFWMLSLVGLIPWLVATVNSTLRRMVYGIGFTIGFIFYLLNTYYVAYITTVGYVTLAICFGLFYWFFIWVVWGCYRRWHWPLTILVPIAWVACEYGRGIGPLAFPFLFLSHTAYRQIGFIQISDILGAYGVSFVMAMVNGFLADVLIYYLSRKKWTSSQLKSESSSTDAHPLHSSRLIRSGLLVAMVLSGSVIYGQFRMRQSEWKVGPRIAVIQGDYPLSVILRDDAPNDEDKASQYLELMEQAATHSPDLLLLPESPWHMSLNDEFINATTFPSDGDFFDIFQRFSRVWDEAIKLQAEKYHSHIVIGSESIEFDQLAARSQDQVRRYNSAFFFDFKRHQKFRYDKIHLVILGEYIPFRNHRYLHFLYRWLNDWHPFSRPGYEFSLTAGNEFRRMSLTDSRSATWRFAIPICFEDLIPSVARTFVSGGSSAKQVDFLLSISNDGWFNFAPVVEQHLAVCVFRAVENRVSIARSVNTGCSGFIDPNGRIHDLVVVDKKVVGPGVMGFSVATIQIDSRYSLYSRWGDLFGMICMIIALGLRIASKIL